MCSNVPSLCVAVGRAHDLPSRALIARSDYPLTHARGAIGFKPHLINVGCRLHQFFARKILSFIIGRRVSAGNCVACANAQGLDHLKAHRRKSSGEASAKRDRGYDQQN